MGSRYTINGQPLEFGNAAQIAFLAKHKSYTDQVMTEGISLEDTKVNLRIEVEFKCVCGNDLQIIEDRDGIDVNEEIDMLLDRSRKTCRVCSCRYKIDMGVIFLIENPKNPGQITKIIRPIQSPGIYE